ncbi:MAG: chemotaxis protein CheW [endosymbiont of Galathealinum brachiosum]|uniref:Chemotaxis protein CheW n=1 Tax=endosymbiont of Galathealinum brachiosum TaxID=2200906 RepID=A0A370DDC1_9GAMM|nr:MAG: chemotaxis protein CheW [endosymbiont of Galathealinum brachiosum]
MQGAFNRLKEIEQKCLERVKDMPSVDGVTDEWTGIGFKIAGVSLLSSMAEVTEILDVPAFTRVPGVKPWVVGIANVRGGLLPLMDLKRFVTGQPVDSMNTARVMVVDHNGLHTGLVVEEVQGMRHFSLGEQAFELPDLDNRLKPYIKQAFKKDNNFWPVFSLHVLVDDERFLHASL